MDEPNNSSTTRLSRGDQLAVRLPAKRARDVAVWVASFLVLHVDAERCGRQHLRWVRSSSDMGRHTHTNTSVAR